MAMQRPMTCDRFPGEGRGGRRGQRQGQRPLRPGPDHGPEERGRQGRPGRLAAAAVPKSALMTEVERQIQAKPPWVINYNFDEVLDPVWARDAITRGDFATASSSLAAARAARNTDPTIFTPAEMSRFDSRRSPGRAPTSPPRPASPSAIRRTSALAAYENTRGDAGALQAANAERDRTNAALIKRTQTLIAESKFSEALNVIDQISAIERDQRVRPGGPALRRGPRRRSSSEDKYKRDYNYHISRQFNHAQEIQIPYDDLLRYPENWPDISEIRDADNARRRGETAQDQQTQQILDKAVPEIRFEGTAFGDVIENLKDLTGANINVEWSVLEAAGVDKTTQVNVGRLTNMRFEKVLRTILDAVGGNGTPLDFFIDEGLITISTKEKIAQQTKTVVYDVSDLLFRPLDAGPPPQLEFQLTAVTPGGGGGGGGGNLFGGQGGGGGQQQDRPPETITRRAHPDDPGPGSTPTSGRRRAASTATSGGFQTGSSYSLIVTATRKTHRDLDQLG